MNSLFASPGRREECTATPPINGNVLPSLGVVSKHLFVSLGVGWEGEEPAAEPYQGIPLSYKFQSMLKVKDFFFEGKKCPKNFLKKK